MKWQRCMKPYRLPVAVITLFLCRVLVSGVYAQNDVYSDPVLISADTSMLSTMAASALDKNGHMHIAFVGWYYEAGAPDNVASEIFYTNNVDGDFFRPEKLPEAVLPISPTFEDDFYYSKEPSIAVDRNGGVHIAYYRTDHQLSGASYICYTNNIKGSFDIPQMLYYNPLEWDSHYRSIGNNIMLAADPGNDSIHIIYTGNSGTGHGGIRYSAGLSGKFRLPVTITTQSERGTIKFDNAGIPAIVYWIGSDTTTSGSNLNLVMSKIRGGRFSAPEIIYKSKGWSPSESCFTFDQYDSIHVVFRNNSIEFGVYNMFYTAGKIGQYSKAQEVYTNTIVSLMYGIRIGKDQRKYIAYKQAAGLQSLGLMAGEGPGFSDFSPPDYNKYGFISASQQWFNFNSDLKKAYFVFTTGQIYLVTANLNTPTLPQNVYPPDHAANVPVNTDFTWNPSGRAAFYQIQVSETSDFANLAADLNQVSDTTVAVTGLEQATSYYWRIQASGAGGISEWSTVWEFSTVNSVGLSELNPVNHVRVFPNPAEDVLYIEEPGNIPYRVTVYSADGKLLMQKDQGCVKEIGLCGLKKGFYLLKLSNPVSVYTIKFVKK